MWRVRLALLALLVVAVLRPGPRWGFPAGVAGLATASLGLVGHAAMQEGLIGAAHRLNHALHLMAAAAWLGGLPPFLVCLALFTGSGGRRDALAAMRRFSRLGHVVVAAALASGALNVAMTSGCAPGRRRLSRRALRKNPRGRRHDGAGAGQSLRCSRRGSAAAARAAQALAVERGCGDRAGARRHRFGERLCDAGPALGALDADELRLFAHDAVLQGQRHRVADGRLRGRVGDQHDGDIVAVVAAERASARSIPARSRDRPCAWRWSPSSPAGRAPRAARNSRPRGAATRRARPPPAPRPGGRKPAAPRRGRRRRDRRRRPTPSPCRRRRVRRGSARRPRRRRSSRR